MKASRIINKLGNMGVSLAFFISLTVLYFFWQPYDKCLIQTASGFDKLVIVDIISRFIYYIIYFSSILMVVRMLFKTKFAVELSFKKTLTKLYFCQFAVRIIFDTIIYLFSKIVVNDKAVILVVFLILESIYNMFVIALTMKFFVDTAPAKRTRQRRFFIALSVTIVLFLLTVLVIESIKCLNIFGMDNESTENKLYYSNALRDVVVSFSSILILYSLYKHKSHSIEKPFKVLCVMTIRIFAVFIIFIIINAAKFLVLPHSMITTISGSGETAEFIRVKNYDDTYKTGDDFPFF